MPPATESALSRWMDRRSAA